MQYLAPGLMPEIKAKHGITSDEELAKLLGCNRATMHRIISHESPLSPLVAARIVTRFGIPMNQIASDRMTRGINDSANG